MDAFPLFKKKRDKQDKHIEQDKRDIIEAMRQTRADLRNARAAFNNACEPELVEAAVYEINALQARYAYYLRMARELKCERKENEAFHPVPLFGDRQLTGKRYN